MNLGNRASGPVAIGLIATLGLACATTGFDPEVEQKHREAEARRDLGMDHLAKGRTAMAIRELAHSASLNDSDAATQLWLGESYRRKGRMEEARRYAELAVRLDPSNHDARLNLSGLYLQMEYFAEASEQAQALIDDPTYLTPWQAFNNRGWAQFRMKQYAQARLSFEEALDYRARYWPARLNLGILAESQGKTREAIEAFGRVVEGSPRGIAAEANFRAAEVYVALGNRPDAIQHFEASLVSSPDGPWSDRSRELLDILR